MRQIDEENDSSIGQMADDEANTSETGVGR